jgi:hypothetical protein
MQIALDVFVFFEGLFVVTMIADIEPIALKGIAHHGAAIGQEALDQVRKVQMFLWLNILQYLMFEDVDTHADLEYVQGFFDVIRNTVVDLMVDNPEIDLEILFIGPDSDKALMLLVELEEVTIVKIGDDIAIHDQKALLQVVHLRQWTNRPQGLILKAIRNVETIPLAMIDIGLNHLCHIAHRQGDMRKAKMLQLTQDRIENGLLSKWD